MVGQITFALDEQGSAKAGDRSAEWRQQAVRQYHQDLIATGEFPQLAGAGPREPTPAPDRDRIFALGLDWLLAGIGASLEPDGPSGGSPDR